MQPTAAHLISAVEGCCSGQGWSHRCACSFTHHALDTLPHTGSLRYDESLPKIPAAAVSTVDASRLAKLSKEAASPLVVRFRLNSRDLGSVTQGNVENGSERNGQTKSSRWEATSTHGTLARALTTTVRVSFIRLKH